MKNKRDDFSKETIKIIASRVGYKCSYPNCRVETLGPHTNCKKSISIGEAAHITAAAPGGPRYDASMTSEERKSANNGIWMCRTHARLIDSDENNYSVELLKDWKYQAECEQQEIINNAGKNNISNKRYKKALRLIKKDINKIHNIYCYLMEYYKNNFYMCNNFIEVNNKIMEMWTLYGEELQENVSKLHNYFKDFSEDYDEYQMDIDDEITENIDKYFSISSFHYQTDGGLGLYDNYYEKLFEMLNDNFDEMKDIISKINYIVEKNYRRKI
ncbi:HNH endonuclease [Clostridium perfringens]|uniref:HNH endonuclease n=1 Tax=Clostridium perfringens TaxID=1502 RepID=UPI0006C4CAA4|nr:HNH endonuclease [Clostridium perfringens]MDH5067971.1 hypothetical protein [Clostridium perfringens]CUO81766.1 Uncharacterised protein [Clostridium perfringens]